MGRSSCSLFFYSTYFKRENSGVSSLIKESHFRVKVCTGYFLIVC